MTKKILIIWTSIMVMLVATLCVVGTNFKSKNINRIMENSLINITKKYYGEYPGLFPKSGKSKKMTVKELKDNGYDAKLEDGCDGYSVVTSGAMGFEYEAYIKCKDYTTKGYEN